MNKKKDIQRYLIVFSKIFDEIIGNKSGYIRKVLNSSESIDSMYSTYFINKKSGGTRMISVPNIDLKKAQKQIAAIFERAILVQDSKQKSFVLADGERYLFSYGASSYGFEYGKNILDNACKHAEHKYFFKTDIKKFFNTFDIGMVKKTVKTAFRINKTSLITRKKYLIHEQRASTKALKRALKLFENEQRCEDLIVALLCCNGKLATGSPASPCVANLYMRPFDMKINVWLKNLEIKTGVAFTYTRYADDICISSNSPIPPKVVEYVRKTLKSFKLEMNEKKTVIQTNKAKNIITGMNITPEGSITVGRKKKEEIKKMLYHSMVLGDNKYSENEVKGNLNYLKQVEPEYAAILIYKYFDLYERKCC